MKIGRSLCSKCAPDHFVLYSLLDSEPAHENEKIIVTTFRILLSNKLFNHKQNHQQNHKQNHKHFNEKHKNFEEINDKITGLLIRFILVPLKACHNQYISCSYISTRFFEASHYDLLQNKNKVLFYKIF